MLFLTIKLNTVETVVSAENLSSYVLSNDTSCVVEAGKCLREDILHYCEQLPQRSRPSMIGQLSTTETELPELVTLFMTELLKTKTQP